MEQESLKLKKVDDSQQGRNLIESVLKTVGAGRNLNPDHQINSAESESEEQEKVKSKLH